MYLTGSQNTTLVTGDHISVTDNGTGNVTILSGNNDYAQLSGSGGTVVSTGTGNLDHVDGTGENLSLSYASLTLGTNASAMLNGDGNSIFVESAVNLTATGDGNTLAVVSGGSTLIAAGNGNVLQGGAGNDVLTATGSNNTFAVGSDPGNDVVHASSSDDSDVMTFGAGVVYDQLWFAQSNNDLVISVIGRGQGVTVADWYASSNSHVGEVTMSDGYSISDAGVEQMVQAMLPFMPPAAGQTTLPPDLASNLAPALAANWQHA